MANLALMLVTVAVVGGARLALVWSGSGCDGAERCHCLPQQRCDPGLECRFDTCWDPEAFPDEYLYTERYQRDAALIHEQIHEAAPVPPGAHVVDVGAGQGAQALYYAAQVGSDGRVFATDIDRATVENLRSLTSDTPQLQARLAGSPRETGVSDLPAESISLVLMVNSAFFESGGDDGPDVRYLTALRRLLKPDGRFVFHMDWLPPTYLRRDGMVRLFAKAGLALERELPMPRHIPRETRAWRPGMGQPPQRLERGFILVFTPAR